MYFDGQIIYFKNLKEMKKIQDMAHKMFKKQESSMTRVFCGECKYYLEGLIGMGADECNHLSNIYQSYNYKEITSEQRADPKRLNYYNDCKNYEEKGASDGI